MGIDLLFELTYQLFQLVITDKRPPATLDLVLEYECKRDGRRDYAVSHGRMAASISLTASSGVSPALLIPGL